MLLPYDMEVLAFPVKVELKAKQLKNNVNTGIYDLLFDFRFLTACSFTDVLLEVVHGGCHVLPCFGLGREELVKSLEIGHLRLIEFECILFLKGRG